MTAIEFPRVATRRELYRVVDRSAATRARAVLDIAAKRTSDALLTSASALLRNEDDEAALQKLSEAVKAPERLNAFIRELRELAVIAPESGACTVATALKLWQWTAKHLRANAPNSALDELAESLAPLLAARCFSIDAGGDLAYVYAAHVAALTGATSAELVFGYRRHLAWDAEGCATCYRSDDLDELEAFIPGFASGGQTSIDVIEADGSHPAKRGPCADFHGLDLFLRLRNRLDACLAGSRAAKDRAADAIGRQR